jgi:hypothetical protein
MKNLKSFCSVLERPESSLPNSRLSRDYILIAELDTRRVH